MAEGTNGYFPPNLRVMADATRLKAVVWHRLAASGAWAYLLHGLFPPEVEDVFIQLSQLCTQIYSATSDASHASDSATREASDREREVQAQRLTLHAITTLCKIESHLPRNTLKYMLHALSHLPAYILRWNSVRNFWCFFMERYVL